MSIVDSVRPRNLTVSRARSGRTRLLDRHGTRSSRRASRFVRKDVMVDSRPTVYGDAGSGPPLLFLYSWGLDHKAYQRGLTRLVTAGLRVIAPAMPGYGGTAPLDNSDCTIRSYAAWVARFLDAMGVEEPLVVTEHSFGGGVAIVVTTNSSVDAGSCSSTRSGLQCGRSEARRSIRCRNGPSGIGVFISERSGSAGLGTPIADIRPHRWPGIMAIRWFVELLPL